MLIPNNLLHFSAATPSGAVISQYVDEKLFLLGDLQRRLIEFQAWCEIPQTDLQPAKRLAGELLGELELCRNLLQDVESLLNIQTRTGIAEKVRLLYRMSSGVLVSADWQSPAIASALVDQCGRYPELIEDYTNDYKRHFHYLARDYERELEGEIRATLPTDYFAKVLVTSCGMSAGSTLFEYLRTIRRGSAKILVDQFVYHETRFLLDKIFPGSCLFLDAADTTAFVRALDEHAPELVVVDSFRNTHDLSVLDLRALLSAAGAAQATFVVDNSCLGPAFDISGLLAEVENNRPKIFQIESLIKLHHYGMDLAGSGFIAALLPAPRHEEERLELEQELKRLSLFRTHFGTHLSDTSAASLPTPRFKQTIARLKQIGRNSRQLYEQLSFGVKHLNLEERVELGFPACRTREMDLSTPYFAFKLLGNEFNREVNYAFVARLIEEARNRNISLVNGTAFGFDITRLYYVESTVETLLPFLRISPGTETPDELTALSQMILEVTNDFLSE